MKPTLALAMVIVATLIRGGLALHCPTCSGDSPSNCTHSEQNCTVGQDACLAKYYKLTKPASDRSVFTMACGRSSECNVTYSMTAPFRREERNSTCCQVDGCVPDTPLVPSTTALPNGLMCESCHSTSSGSCTSPGTMECTGMEDKCLKFVVTITAGFLVHKASFSGCASESYCRKTPSSESRGVTVVMDVNCTGIEPTVTPSTGISPSNGSTFSTTGTSNPNMNSSTSPRPSTGTSTILSNGSTLSTGGPISPNLNSSTSPRPSIGASTSLSNGSTLGIGGTSSHNVNSSTSPRPSIGASTSLSNGSTLSTRGMSSHNVHPSASPRPSISTNSSQNTSTLPETGNTSQDIRTSPSAGISPSTGLGSTMAPSTDTHSITGSSTAHHMDLSTSMRSNISNTYNDSTSSSTTGDAGSAARGFHQEHGLSYLALAGLLLLRALY